MSEISEVLRLFAILFVFRIVILAGGTLLLQRTTWARSRQVYALEIPPGQRWSELRYGVVIIAFDSIFQPLLLASPLATLTDVSLMSVALPIALGFVVNELWFYFTHRLMHTKPLYFIHAQHHIARVPDPLTTVSFSLAEHVIAFVPVNLALIALSAELPMSALGLLAFGVLTEIGNLYGHANIEPWGPGFGQTRLGKVFVSPTYHAMHHARYTGNYGLFTRVLDRLLGTQFDDYEQLQARTGSGRPLRSLAERGTVDEALATDRKVSA